ncbi:MAG TPA: ABC transporter ATP-binding protein [Kofleriaceae bacterium]|jgi:putative ABC transport system ATP-binding protein|nr:ABC transporter ATP-binding protein [Kofleriaceae bacterium]
MSETTTTSDAAPEPYRGTVTTPTIVKLSGIAKTFYRGNEPIKVLDGLDLDVPNGSFEALMGPSGSGKSTLLNIIAGLDRPTSGTVLVAGADLTRLSDGQLARWRSQTIGFVFQSFNLIPVLTAAENVELPLLLTSLSRADRVKHVATALRIVGLEDRMHHYPRQLSGGQEQRVAIARAIVNDPKIIVADEPTGDLDRKSADDVLLLMERLNKELHKTIFMVTHDPAAAERAGVQRKLDKGALQ